MRRLSIAGMATVLFLLFVPAHASGGGQLANHKVDIWHLLGNGTFLVFMVAAEAVPAHTAHGDLVVDQDVDENCDPLNRPPVAYDGEPAYEGNLLDLAFDPDGDRLYFRHFNLNPEDNDRWSFASTGFGEEWVAGCFATRSPTSSFQWVASDKKRGESNVPSQPVECRPVEPGNAERLG